MVASEQGAKVVAGIETADVIETALIFPVAALHLAVMTGRIRTNQLVADAQLCRCFLQIVTAACTG